MQYIWSPIRGGLRVPFEMVQWSSHCDHDIPSRSLLLSRFILRYHRPLHLPFCTSGSKGYWLGCYGSRGRARLVTQEMCHRPWIDLCTDPWRSQPYIFASMEDMGHRYSGMLDVICGAPSYCSWINNGQLTLPLSPHDWYSMLYVLCSFMLSFLFLLCIPLLFFDHLIFSVYFSSSKRLHCTLPRITIIAHHNKKINYYQLPGGILSCARVIDATW